jgi:ribosomal protein L37E
MQEAKCRNCGSYSVQIKEIELRHINPNSMALRSSQMVQESECINCGLVLSLTARQVAPV